MSPEVQCRDCSSRTTSRRAMGQAAHQEKPRPPGAVDGGRVAGAPRRRTSPLEGTAKILACLPP